MPGDDALAVHQLFEDQVRLVPDRPAVCAGARILTYRQLDDKAARLASFLHRYRRSADHGLVGLCLPRGIGLVVAVIAASKAGIGWLPVDPSHPAPRQRQIFAAAPLDFVLTTKDQVRSLSGAAETVTTVDEALAQEQSPRFRSTIGTAPDIACVIFTSGSTGAPKGVMLEQPSLMAFARWAHATWGIGSHDRFSLLASPGFDASLLEIWPALAAGACIDVVDPGVRLAPRLLRDWLLSRKITHSFLTTALGVRLLELSWPSAGCELRMLLIGGEPLIKRPDPALPFQVVNCYGPTEGTIIATTGIVAPTGVGTGLPTIGKPLPYANVRIFDEKFRPAEVGELYISGAGVARGYLGRPDLTAKWFLPDPFDPAAKMYRTGDLGRRRADGEIEFHGRVDMQVKIRGNRVEPYEATLCLTSHPAVATAHVTPGVDDATGETYLAAYVVPKALDQPPTAADLRRFAAQFLPRFLVPKLFIILPELPLTANGKIDNAVLPGPGQVHSSPRASLTFPATELERKIVELWKTILGTDQVGLDESFYDLGGHSLLLIELHTRLTEDLGCDVPIDVIMTHDTVRALAKNLPA